MGDEPYAAVLPWVVFAVVARGHGQELTWAAIGALVTTATCLATQRRSSSTPNVLAIGALGWFGALAIAGATTSSTGWLAQNSRAASAIGFSIIAIASLAFTPITEFYFRPHTRSARWTESSFKRLNISVTLLWASIFGLMAASHITAHRIDTPSAYTVFNWVVPIALVVLATHRTRSVWDEYVEDAAEGILDDDPLWEMSLGWDLPHERSNER